jgi:hypothetical protein
MNTAQLMARFDPDYQMKLQKVQQTMELERYRTSEKWQQLQYMAGREDQNAQYRAEQEEKREVMRGENALSVESKRGENALTLADKDHQNKFSQLQSISEREDQREEMKGQTALNLADKAHTNQLAQIQAEFQNQVSLSAFNSGISAVHKLMDENNKKRESLLKRREDRNIIRGRCQELVMETVANELLAKNQHARELEKMNLASSLNQAEQYFQSVCLYLSQLLEASKEEEAKAEIDRLFSEWGAGNV